MKKPDFLYKTLSLLCCALAPFFGLAQNHTLESFPLSSVQLLESPFRQAQQTDMKYILALDPDRLLAPYLQEAGLQPNAKNYGNWENTGLDGHIGGHYLTALSLMYAATGNTELQQRLTYMVDQLERCQQKNGNGYIGGVPGGEAMWQEIANGNVQAESFSLNGKWVPWYNIHKLYAGLRDAYLIAGNEKAKDMLVKLSDWSIRLTHNLTDAQMQDMLRSEHGGMNEVFADVAAITGDQKYLELARRFSHRSVLDPLLAEKDVLNGMHANTQIPKVIGYKRVAEVAGDPAWAAAADFFWGTVVNNRTVSIGGNSVREHFHPADNFSSMVESKEGPETCNTYNMLKLSKQLYLSSASTDYLDYYERGLYNHILSSQHPTRGGFVYFTPMRPRHYRVYSQPEEGFWCCVGSGLENHGKYGELIYAHQDQNLFVNLFIPSTLNWEAQGLEVTQQTRFPFEEATKLLLKLKKPQKFALSIRRPAWVKPGGMAVRVNNKEVKAQDNAAAYVTVERKWRSGDVVTVSLPMETKAEYLPDNSRWVSFVHGPIVLAAVTDTTDLQGLVADGSRMGHIANGPLYPVEEAPVLVTDKQDLAAGIKPVAGKPLTFTASSLIASDRYKNVELVPFFQVHDARYMLYWPVASPEEMEARKAALHEREAARMALESMTVDQVAPGEQQPESDHNYKGDKTESGVYRDRHWRHASGWFSYDLRDASQEARKLRVTYFGLDKDRTFDILVNGTLLKTVTLDGSHGDQFFEEDYTLPESLLAKKSKMLQVKFVAHKGSVAGGIYEVRLMK
ncbi:glycoside hydrolase family 127 protein [Pontibacter sp. E15-1]|uniref:glycoside hydrolase family 127 protein n=1 Tax=Pontibacter sp. E15-1 TaxID=2919918 RepID=UPI001F4FD062|nr:glycoside hydrolase family 127 protein [Pontibacter sp. E15-1]MCJ8164320.1 glycoside hydrolase family 127 protein [Pontibacter sp. E15-1]